MNSPISRRSTVGFHQTDQVVRLKLAAKLYELCDLLGQYSHLRVKVLRQMIADARRLQRASRIDDGLLELVLRNLLVDARGSITKFDAEHHAAELCRVAEMLEKGES